MQKVAVGIIGPGLVGSALLSQIVAQAPTLQSLLRSSIKVVGVANSKCMLVSGEGISPDTWKEDLTAKGQKLDLSAFGSLLKGVDSDCRILVDCTASDEPPSHYLEYARQGIHIVTPNKKFGAGPLTRIQEMKQIPNSLFMYEATVGAGLPVISTLRSLIETGDKILKIEGVLSGTLSFIFNTYRSGTSFSQVVADAKAHGYTEPDPREDLSGMDVARKVVILARECGLPLELNQLRVESLVPEPLAALPSVDEYMEQLPQYDDDIGSKATEAAAGGKVIRYIGCVDVEHGECSVELATLPRGHPFAQLTGTDNMLVFTTQRYHDRPLVVQGPGAGTAVTAAGIFSDIIQVVRAHRHAAAA